MTSEERAAISAAFEEISNLDNAERENVTYAGHMAAEAILCALPPMSPAGALKAALVRLRGVDELIWALAYVIIGKNGDEGWPRLHAERFHSLEVCDTATK